MTESQYDGVGLVETEYFTCCQSPHQLVLQNGEKVDSITQAYETYGKLNSDKSNAILICHALTGDAHAAGWHEGDKKPGWWDKMIGPGKAFDTDKYFIICLNCLGSCKGTTGPSTINPKTGEPYGLTFPVFTFKDVIDVQKCFIDKHFGIKQFLAVAGGSMGGVQTLQWATSYPEYVRSAIVIATNYRHTAQQIALHVVGRQAIMSDPDWLDGNYYGKSLPARGLALARMLGHITYMSEKSMHEKFGRKFTEKNSAAGKLQDFEVGSYLKYRGDSFVQRFDANSYLYLTKALDYFDLSSGGDLKNAFKEVQSKFLVLSFTSDWLYPVHQSQEIVRALKASDIDVSSVEINASYGHDSFLVEVDSQSHLISHFLSRVDREN